MAETTATVSLEEYLASSYSPDVEYIDGELKEKSVTGFPHGVLQGLLFQWFRSHRNEWDTRVSVETRTLVSLGRVRLPDVVVVRKGDESGGALTKAPLIAIEILSLSDRYTDLKARATDLHAMGTENIWLIDAEKRTAEIWTGRQWAPLDGNTLRAVNAPVFLDLDWLWAELDD